VVDPVTHALFAAIGALRGRLKNGVYACYPETNWTRVYNGVGGGRIALALFHDSAAQALVVSVSKLIGAAQGNSPRFRGEKR